MGVLIVIVIILVIIIRVSNGKIAKDKQIERAVTLDVLKRQVKNDGFVVSAEANDCNEIWALVIDEEKKQWAILDANPKEVYKFDYKDLVQYEIIEDGNMVLQGRVGSVLAGAALFGGVGALAGGARSKKVSTKCNDLRVNVVVNNIANPRFSLQLIFAETDKGSVMYRTSRAIAENVAALFAVIKDATEREFEDKSVNTIEQSVSNEIEKLFELKERGILTEEEFEAKKRQILGI